MVETKVYCIYTVRNVVNDKHYVGVSNNVGRRIKAHKGRARHGNPLLFYQAIRKYGWHSFVVSTICSTRDEAYAYEVLEPYFIQQYDSMADHNGYNLHPGGKQFHWAVARRMLTSKTDFVNDEGLTVTQFHFTPETRQLISERTRTAMQDPALREFLSKHSAEWLAANPDHHDKMLAGAEAQRQSSGYEATRQKLTATAKANFTDESLVKMQEGARLYWKGDASLERRRRMAELMAKQRPLGDTSWNKGRAWTGEEKARQSQAHLGKTASEATKAKIAESTHQRAVARKKAGLPARRTGLVKLSDATRALIGQKAQKYSDETFSEIYRRRQAGERTTALAREYGMAVTIVSSIGSGKHPRIAKLLLSFRR